MLDRQEKYMFMITERRDSHPLTTKKLFDASNPEAGTCPGRTHLFQAIHDPQPKPEIAALALALPISLDFR